MGRRGTQQTESVAVAMIIQVSGLDVAKSLPTGQIKIATSFYK